MATVLVVETMALDGVWASDLSEDESVESVSLMDSSRSIGEANSLVTMEREGELSFDQRRVISRDVVGDRVARGLYAFGGADGGGRVGGGGGGARSGVDMCLCCGSVSGVRKIFSPCCSGLEYLTKSGLLSSLLRKLLEGTGFLKGGVVLETCAVELRGLTRRPSGCRTNPSWVNEPWLGVKAVGAACKASCRRMSGLVIVRSVVLASTEIVTMSPTAGDSTRGKSKPMLSLRLLEEGWSLAGSDTLA